MDAKGLSTQLTEKSKLHAGEGASVWEIWKDQRAGFTEAGGELYFLFFSSSLWLEAQLSLLAIQYLLLRENQNKA